MERKHRSSGGGGACLFLCRRGAGDGGAYRHHGALFTGPQLEAWQGKTEGDTGAACSLERVSGPEQACEGSLTLSRKGALCFGFAGFLASIFFLGHPHPGKRQTEGTDGKRCGCSRRWPSQSKTRPGRTAAAYALAVSNTRCGRSPAGGRASTAKPLCHGRGSAQTLRNPPGAHAHLVWPPVKRVFGARGAFRLPTVAMRLGSLPEAQQDHHNRVGQRGR